MRRFAKWPYRSHFVARTWPKCDTALANRRKYTSHATTQKTAAPRGDGFVTRDYAFTFSFALLASALNAAMSFTARSASILRFTVMPASFKPCIMRL